MGALGLCVHGGMAQDYLLMLAKQRLHEVEDWAGPDL